MRLTTKWWVATRFPRVGGFDYVTLDSSARRLYVSHATQVDVLDADSGKVVGTIPDTPGVHGVAIASAFKHGFTSNGRENKVSMFDPTTLQLIKKIDVGKGPDGIYYDPGSKRVFTNNHGSHDITAIDAEKGEVVGTVKAEGDGEQAVDRRRWPYLCQQRGHCRGSRVSIQSHSRSKSVFPSAWPRPRPVSPMMRRRTACLSVAATEPKMVVMDAATGKVINSFPIGKGVDYAGFDPGAGLIFFSCGDGTLSIYHEKSADVYEDAGAVKTQPSAKTMAFDPKTKKIFLPAAEYLETPANRTRQAAHAQREARLICGSGSQQIITKARHDHGGTGQNQVG